MGRRGGIKNKIKKRVAHLKWLLYTSTSPLALSTRQKLQAEVDFLKTKLTEKTTQPSETHSAHIPTTYEKRIIKVPTPKQLPRMPDNYMQIYVPPRTDSLCEDQHRQGPIPEAPDCSSRKSTSPSGQPPLAPPMEHQRANPGDVQLMQ